MTTCQRIESRSRRAQRPQAEWFSQALDCHVRAVEVIDAHSGTTGRARVRLPGARVPETSFVKLQPFSQDQRELIRQVGLGVAEARVTRTSAASCPCGYLVFGTALIELDDGAFVMVLEDLTLRVQISRHGRRGHPGGGHSTVEELAKLHAAYQGRELPWLRTAEGMRAKPDDLKVAAAVRCSSSALDKFGVKCRCFPAFGRAYIERNFDVVTLFGEGEHTLIHGDSHIGNLFVDDGRTVSTTGP